MKDLEKRMECSGLMNYYDVKNKYCIYALSNEVKCEYLSDNKSKVCDFRSYYRLPLIILKHK